MGFGSVYRNTPGPPVWIILILGVCLIASFLFMLHSWGELIDECGRNSERVRVIEKYSP